MIVPKSRPQWPREKVQSLLVGAGVTDPVAILGVRGYYRDTMGAAGRNDRGIYDDALFVISPEAFVSFNANTDPSTHRTGIAVLKPGLWKYRIGIHGLSKPVSRQYQALVQAADVTVVRDGKGDDTGRFGINIHRGSLHSTSSLGCQTLYPSQWESFISLVESELDRHAQKIVPYLLIEGQG